MIFWSITLVLLAIAVLCVLLPLSGALATGKGEADAESVYRSQLVDLDGQIARAQTPSTALMEERAEIARRLLKEADRKGVDKTSAGSRKTRIAASMFGLVAVPAVSLLLYAHTGAPGTPDAPLAARQNLPLEERSVKEVVDLAEKHLAKNPNDPEGWALLAQVYRRLDAPRKRANAIQQLIRIRGNNPELTVELAEALTRADANVISTRAKAMFEQALRAKPDLHKARFYLAVALGQEGRHGAALTHWRLLADIRLDDPVWQATIKRELSKSRAAAGLPVAKGPTAQDIAAAAGQTAQERSQMIQGMVSGLADRLMTEPDDLAGWQQLVRSYSVLKMQKEAKQALSVAKKHFSSKPQALSELIALEKQLKLNVQVNQ